MTEVGNPLDGVEALTFDVFGTVVDYHGTVAREVLSRAQGQINEVDAAAFANEWRQGYYKRVFHVASGGEGVLIVDEMHRQILDEMLSSPRWSHLGSLWSEQELQDLNLVWHRLEGWPDATEGLHELKKHIIICALSNGNVRLLVDMAKHANLPWDVVFSSEMIGIFKPNPKMYLSAAQYLSIPPEKVAMVAAHIGDLRGAMRSGLKTIYVPRSTEDAAEVTAQVKTKKEGGEVDVIASNFVELAKIVASRKR